MSSIQFTDTGDPLNFQRLKGDNLIYKGWELMDPLPEILNRYEQIYTWGSGMTRALTSHNHIPIIIFQ